MKLAENEYSSRALPSMWLRGVRKLLELSMNAHYFGCDESDMR
jgi:hypothetical protein